MSDRKSRQKLALLFNLKFTIMSVFISTTFGKISGRHGTAVAVNLKGKSVLRVFTKPSNPRTKAQVAHRAKFEFTSLALNPLRPVIKDGFGNSLKAYGKAFSIAFKNAVTGEAPNLSIDWSKIVLSTGQLLLPLSVETSKSGPNSLKIDWDTDLYNTASDDDLVYVALFNEKAQALVYLNAQAIRSVGSVTFDLPTLWELSSLKIWMFFSTSDRSHFSNSVFINHSMV